MRKDLLVMGCLVLVLAVAGCTRVYKATRDRVDIEVAGNQGVIYGPRPAAHQVANPTREIIGVDVELPTAEEIKEAIQEKSTKKKTPDIAVEGNVGVVSQPQEAAAAIPPSKPEKIK